MSKHINERFPARRVAQFCGGVLAVLLLVACGSNAKRQTEKAHEAAIYNVQLGLAYMNQGDLERAKDKLDRALSQDPDNADVHSARATLFARLNQKDKADEEFRAALRLAPHDPRMVNNYAVYLCQNGRNDEGVKRFLEAARNPLYPTPEAAYTNAGVCLRAAKRDDEARLDFTRALQLKPNFADSFIGNYNATADLLLLGVRIARAQGDRLGAQRYARKLQLDFPGTDQARALAQLDHPG